MSGTHQLEFAEINILQADLAEVIVYENVEIDAEMVAQVDSCLIEHLQAPFSVLFNRRYAYSFTFEGRLKITGIPEINAVAVVSYTNTTTVATKALIVGTSYEESSFSIFDNRPEAVAWLVNEQKKLSLS